MLSITKVRGNSKVSRPHEERMMVPLTKKRDIRHVKMPWKPSKCLDNDLQIRDLWCAQSKGLGILSLLFSIWVSSQPLSRPCSWPLKLLIAFTDFLLVSCGKLYMPPSLSQNLCLVPLLHSNFISSFQSRTKSCYPPKDACFVLFCFMSSNVMSPGRTSPQMIWIRDAECQREKSSWKTRQKSHENRKQWLKLCGYQKKSVMTWLKTELSAISL